jgi:hypothetical protein
MIAIGMVLAGIYVLFSINGVATATGYSVAWAFIVLVATRVALGIGSGYNALRGRWSRGRPVASASAASALQELTDLHGRDLISDEEYAAKRASVLERL